MATSRSSGLPKRRWKPGGRTSSRAGVGARSEEVAAQEAVIDGLELAISTARANVADAGLRAPFGGIIARRLVENFANVQAKEPIAVLQKLEPLSLSFDVPGPDVSELAAAAP